MKTPLERHDSYSLTLGWTPCSMGPSVLYLNHRISPNHFSKVMSWYVFYHLILGGKLHILCIAGLHWNLAHSPWMGKQAKLMATLKEQVLICLPDPCTKLVRWGQTHLVNQPRVSHCLCQGNMLPPLSPPLISYLACQNNRTIQKQTTIKHK